MRFFLPNATVIEAWYFTWDGKELRAVFRPGTQGCTLPKGFLITANPGAFMEAHVQARVHSGEWLEALEPPSPS